MKRLLAVMFVAGSIAALPALAQPRGRSNANPAGPNKTMSKTNTEGNKVLTSSQTSNTKVRSITNPAGSHTMVMTKSGQGANKTMSKAKTNTEGNKVLTSSRSQKHIKANRVAKRSKRHLKSNAQLARLHRRHRR